MYVNIHIYIYADMYKTDVYQPYTGWQARSWGEVVMKSNTASSIIEQSYIYYSV